ncbi:MAG: hypothetical protein D6677_01915, partial [Calditrichaeota bacterium]
TDTFALIKCLDGPIIKAELNEVVIKLERKIPLMLAFLKSMGGALKEPPLWGDTALDMMYPFEDLEKYVNQWIPLSEIELQEKVILSQSGFVVHRNPQYHFIFKTSDFGPAYQPGHSHCDALAFTLHVEGEPVFVDSGLANYRNTSVRRYARCTTAHNTVFINGLEQAECWHAFRMARRISTSPPDIKQGEKAFSVTGCYSHNWGPSSKRYQHSRTITFFDGYWLIVDEITGGEKLEAHSRFHLHPDYKVNIRHEFLELSNGKQNLFFVYKGARIRFSLKHGHYYYNYDKDWQNIVIELSSSVAQKIKMSYVISLPEKWKDAQKLVADLNL